MPKNLEDYILVKTLWFKEGYVVPFIAHSDPPSTPLALSPCWTVLRIEATEDWQIANLVSRARDIFNFLVRVRPPMDDNNWRANIQFVSEFLSSSFPILYLISILPSIMNTSTTNVPRALLRKNTSLGSIDKASNIVSEKDNSSRPRIVRRRSIGSFSSVVDQESSLATDGLVFIDFHTNQPFEISV